MASKSNLIRDLAEERGAVRPRGERKKRGSSEDDLQLVIITHIRDKYPDALFQCDMSGVMLSIGQAVKQKRLGMTRGWPDLKIMEPRGGHHGLFIELKRAGTKIYLRDGKTMVANEHFREQEAVMQRLRDRGYAATFAVGMADAVGVIDRYMALPES